MTNIIASFLSLFKLVSTERAHKTLLRLPELERAIKHEKLSLLSGRGDHTGLLAVRGAHFREGLEGSSTKGVEQGGCPLRKVPNYGKGEDVELTRIPPTKRPLNTSVGSYS